MTKNQDRMLSHTMELPRLIVIGQKNIGDIGKFLTDLAKPKKVSLISGTKSYLKGCHVFYNISIGVIFVK